MRTEEEQHKLQNCLIAFARNSNICGIQKMPNSAGGI